MRAIADDFGLPPDTPAKLMAATTRHLGQQANAADAVLAAATELGIDPAAAVKLAALAG
ncbi:hypothetical protein [Nonomuraea sp. LPB2021202275-12-8]|uniref:hypothetical protein n=1 Tax=Nonomuraea sp. LPB2021202275-12-8 TaxID=3120159 RepID=UPI00300C27D0